MNLWDPEASLLITWSCPFIVREGFSSLWPGTDGELCQPGLQFAAQSALFGSLRGGQWGQSGGGSKRVEAKITKPFPRESPYKHKTPRKGSEEITDGDY